jgi:3-isopropylmalate/(R)-2-methylmalate dehydratase large subunit
MATLVDAGVTVTTPGCGACWVGNQSPGELADGEVCITTSTENSAGRMGSATAAIYIANAAVVAASAIEGRIADPRAHLVVS